MKKRAIAPAALLLTVLLSSFFLRTPVSKGENQPPPPPELTVEEYKLAADAEELLKDQDCINLGCVPEQILGRRKKWREADPVNRINEQLKPLNYRFNKYKDKYGVYCYNLYKGSRLLYAGLRQVRGFSINSDQSKFMFVAEGSIKNKSRTCIYGEDKIIDCAAYLPLYNIPFFYRDKIIKIEVIKNTPNLEQMIYAGVKTTRKRYQIRTAERPLYTADIFDYPSDSSIQQFYTREGHWVLEYIEVGVFAGKPLDYNGTVVVDGVNLNKKFGLKEVFNYTFLKGQPFYFYRSPAGHLRISYAGKPLPYIYENVIYYACCSQAALNPKSNEHMISFFAYKGGSLYYVEAGIYN